MTLHLIQISYNRDIRTLHPNPNYKYTQNTSKYFLTNIQKEIKQNFSETQKAKGLKLE